jgi:polyferredoxin
MMIGKAQIWMAILFASIILAAYFGRFYCGWMCPMNTLIRPTKSISKKLGLLRKDVPEFFKTNKPKYVAFVFFLVGLAYTIFTITQGRKFPLPLIIIPIALSVTLLVNETTWHTYLCPWGTLFSFTARFSRFKINSDECIGCAACKLSCPAEALHVNKEKGTVSDPKICLVCLECVPNCPARSMGYRKENE